VIFDQFSGGKKLEQYQTVYALSEIEGKDLSKC
jgi:hypothetical protein